MKRKILVTLLAFCLIASLCVVGAAADSTTLPGAVEGVMTLTENVTMYSSDFDSALDNYYDDSNKELIIDLGQNTLTLTGGKGIVIQADKSLTIKNGYITAAGYANGVSAVFAPQGGTSFILDNVTMTTNGTAIYAAGNATAIEIRDSSITAGVYVVGTNASTDPDTGELIYSDCVDINIYNSRLEATYYQNPEKRDTCTILLNVPGTLDIDESTIIGGSHAIILRGGDIHINNSNVSIVDPPSGYDEYEEQDWESGNGVPSAAITVGNRNGAYKYEVSCEITNTTVSAPDGDNSIYYYQMDERTGDSEGVDRTATLKINSGSFGTVSVNGDYGVDIGTTVEGGSFANSVAAYVADGLEYEAKSDGGYTYHRTIESAVAAAGNGGSVSMISNGAAVDPDDEGVHTITRIDGGSEITMTVTDGYVYTLPELYKNGYTFTGWRVNSSNTIVKGGESYPITANTTFTAVWNMIMIPDTYDIAVDQPAHGTVDVSLSNASQGSVITVTATPDEGYELVYITVDGEPISGSSFVMPDHAVEVSAVFAEIGKEVNFVDVSRADWFYDYVQYVAQNGLMEGTTRTAFEPNASMTRAMFWTVLARIDGETITGDAWKTLAQTWAVESGISDGTNADALITREQMVTMLYRYAGSPVTGGMAISAFTDGASVSDYATDAVTWALSEGILTGMGDGILAPQGTATRAQAAAMLMRFVEA